ncbi:MAG: 50S ribosomal protein L25 [Planctomycetes bacterium]|nr:50S ribosomal protein L25 [Planctomycetota bacterium]
MKAERRTALGRNRIAALRAQGWLPAVVYGEGQEALSISISEWELEQHVKAHHRVFQLDIGGQAQAAFLQEIAWQATTDRPLHADFKRIDLNKPIDAEVEVSLKGHPVGVGKGGVLMKDHMVVTVRCLPTVIPDSIEHDVSKLEIDDYVTAGQLVLPAGVVLVTPATTSVCHVAKLVVQEVAAPAAAAPAEGAAAAEGAKPAEGAKAAEPAKDAKKDAKK